MMHCVADYESLVHKKMPRIVADFISAGSWQQQTVAANTADFQKIAIQQRVVRDISAVEITASLLDYSAAAPIVISPTGMNGLIHPRGELAVAQAAAVHQVPYCCSLASSYSIESLAEVTDKNLWLQVSFLKDTDFLLGLLDRALQQGIKHLVLTVDFHLSGRRFSDERNGLVIPFSWRRLNYLNVLTKPRWWRSYLAVKPPPMFGNIIGHAKGVHNMNDFVAWYQGQFDLVLSWGKIDWLRQRWPGTLLIKGVLHPEDIRLAFELGADAVSLSNHGGRQLDGAPSTISRLEQLTEEVRTLGPIFLDGGVRTGQDIYKAISLGATGVLLGRAPLYGLALQGERGVQQILTILKNELTMSLALSGVNQLNQLSREQVLVSKRGFECDE